MFLYTWGIVGSFWWFKKYLHFFYALLFFDELVTNECKYTLAIDDFPTPTSPRSTILAEYIGAFSSCLTLWLTGVGARALLNEAKS